MATNIGNQICELSDLSSNVHGDQKKRFVKNRPARSRNSGNFPKRQYHPIQDSKDYQREAQELFDIMKDYKRLWGFKVREERSAIDRMISLLATRRNIIRNIQDNTISAEDPGIVELLTESDPRNLGLTIDLGEAQSGCEIVRPQPKKKNKFDKMYATYNSLMFTSESNSNLNGNTTIQRQEEAEKKCRRIKGAVETFMYFYTSHGYVDECDIKVMQRIRDWVTVFHIWHMHVAPAVKRGQHKLVQAETQIQYNKAYKETIQILRKWLINPFALDNQADIIFDNKLLTKEEVLSDDRLVTEHMKALDLGEAQSGVEDYDMNAEWEANDTMIDPKQHAEDRQMTNVVMVDDEETTVEGQSKTKDAETIPQSIREMPNNIESILSKPQRIRAFNWATTNPSGWNLMQDGNAGQTPVLFPWFMMTPPGTSSESCVGSNWKNVLSNFGFFRSGLRFFVKLNTIKANAGMLKLVWAPMANVQAPDFRVWNTWDNYPHVDIDASVSNSAELVIPYIHFRDFFPLCDDVNSEYSSLGALMLIVWNPLMVGTGTLPNVSGTVWACFDKPELHQPKWYVSNESMFTNHMRSPVQVLGPHSEQVSELLDLGEAQMDIISEGSALLEDGAKVVERVMKLAGNIICDKPSVPKIPPKVSLTVVDPPVTGSGSDHSVRMGLNPLGHIKNGPQYRSCVTDQTNFPTLLDNYNRLTPVDVSTSTTPWTQLYWVPVTPSMVPYYRIMGTNSLEARPTTLAYISHMFGAWSGSIKYRFRAIVSDLHSVRFAIRYDPHTGSLAGTQTPDSCSKEQSNIIIWDVAERKEIEVEIPYMSLRPVLRCGAFIHPTDNTNFGVGTCANGILSLFLYQNLRCPSIASSNIQVNVDIAAGSDFKLWYVQGVNHINSIYFNPIKQSWLEGTPPLYIKANDNNYTWMFYVNELFKLLDPKAGKVFELTGVTYDKWLKAWQDLVKKYPAAKKLQMNRLAIDGTEKSPYKNNLTTVVSIGYPMPDMQIQQCYAYAAGLGTWQIFNWQYKTRSPTYMPEQDISGYLGLDKRDKFSYESRTAELPPYTVSIMQSGWEAQSGEEKKSTPKDAVKEPKKTDADSKPSVAQKKDKAPTRVLPKRNVSKSNVVRPIVLGKPRTIKTQDYVMGENWMNMRAILKRYYNFGARTLEPPFKDNQHFIWALPVQPIMSGSDLFNYKVTPLSYLAHLYTFWRGSLRFKIFLPGVSGVSMKVVYQPFQTYWFDKWEDTLNMERMLSACGEVLYSGNVMGALEVEVPFASVYQRLTTFPYVDLTSQCGTLFLAVVVPPEYAQSLEIQLYHAVGEDFEFMVPKEVPTIFFAAGEDRLQLNDTSRDYHDASGNNTYNQQWRIMKEKGTVVRTQKMGGPLTLEATRGMTAQSGTEDEDSDCSGQTMVFHNKNANDDMSLDDTINGVFKTGKILAEAGPKIEHSMASLTGVITALEKMSNLMPRVTKVIDKVGEAAENISDASYDVSKFFNMGRIGVVVMGVYTFLTSEDLTTRMIALGGVGLAIGIGPEVAANCVNWVMSTLGWEEPVWKVPQRKVHDVGTAQSIGEFVQDHSTAFKWCAASTAVLIFFTLFGGYPKKGDVESFSDSWASKLKNFHFAGQAVRTADWLFKWISEVIQGALSWAFNLEAGGYLTRKILADKCNDILEWVDRINALETDEAILQAIWDPNRQQDVWQLMDKAKELTELVTKNQNGGNLAVHINHGMRKLNSIEKRLAEATVNLPSRIDPLCVCLFGDAGVGKSSLLATLLNYTADGLGYAKTNRIYSRNACDKFWSRYVGQPFVVEDDFAQNVDGDDVAEFINLKSNFGMNLNMGELAEKGRPFTSHFIFQTTNNPFPKPTIVSSIPALWRRREILVKVTGQKSDDFSKLKFTIIDPLSEIEKPIVKDINVEQLIDIIVIVASHHLDEQRKLVWRDLNQGLVITSPKGERSGWEKEANEKAMTIIELSRQARDAGIPDPAPIRLRKKNVSISNKYNFKSVKRVGQHSKGDWESQADTPVQDDAEYMGEVLCSATAVRNMVSRLSVGDAQKYLLATDKEIQQYIDEVYRYNVVKPTIEQVKAEHGRIFERSRGEKTLVKDGKSGSMHDATSYSDKLWMNVLLDNGKYQLRSNVPDDVELEWELAEHDLGEVEWQKVCSSHFEAPKEVKQETFIITKLKKAIEDTKCWVHNWFKEHPKIFKMMKILCGFAGIFAGWKIVKWMMPEMCAKVEEKIAEWFGIVYDSKPISYVREKAAPTVNKARGVVNKVSKRLKNFFGYENTEEEDFKDLVDKALEKYEEDDIAMVVESSAKEAVKGLLKAESKVYNIPTSVRAPKTIHYGSAQSEYSAQGTCDKQAENLVSKCISRSLHRCRYMLSDGHFAGVNVLALKGHCVLMPWHAIEQMEEDQYVYFYRGGTTITFRFDSKRVKRIGDTDAGIWNLGIKWPCAADLSKHFIRESDCRISKTKAELEVVKALAELEGDTRLQSHIVDVELLNQVDYNLPDKTRRNKQVGWVYTANTVPGDCGGVLVAFNPRMQRKLIGIHTAGKIDASMGFSVLLTGEMLDETMTALDEQFAGLPFVSQGAVFDEEAFTRCKIIPNGNFSLIGVMREDLAVGCVTKSTIKPSLLFDRVFPHTTEPSVLCPYDMRLDKPISPMLQAVNKYGVPTIPYSKNLINQVNESIFWDLKTIEVIMEKRLLTLTEVIYGNDLIPFCDRMNMASSPGYPYVLTRPSGEKGKLYLFDQDGIVSDDLKHRYEIREELARSGKRCESIWVDSLKDERRTLDKIALGKTRQFTIPPVDFTMLMRKYFMSFAVNFYANNVKFFSAVGIDPYSFQWTELYFKLRKNSNLSIGGDFHAFDGIADPELYMNICNTINRWYDDGPVNAMVRKILFHELIHTNHLCWNLLYFKHQGNPSGNPLTVVINTIMVVFYLRLTWLELANLLCPDKASITDYRENVAEICYGDDFLITIKGDVVDWFNMIHIVAALKEHAIELTDENKSGNVEPVRHLDDMKFLKNSFISHVNDKNWKLAAISQDTIRELINWVKESDDPVQMLKDNIHDAYRFAYFHGEEFYNSFTRLVNEGLRTINIEPLMMSWHSWDAHFRLQRA